MNHRIHCISDSTRKIICKFNKGTNNAVNEKYFIKLSKRKPSKMRLCQWCLNNLKKRGNPK